LTLDVMDVAGEHQSDISHSVYKVQLSPDGSEIKRERAPSKTFFALFPWFGELTDKNQTPDRYP
jgi:hypothetical protein